VENHTRSRIEMTTFGAIIMQTNML